MSLYDCIYIGIINISEIILNLMSWAWRKESWLPWCWWDWWPCYATDTNQYWHNNVYCLTHLKWTYVPDDYNFRLIK